ncbi:MAG: 4Fe-4S dicluster domain-containing protein [Candidatus Anammoxibacter sp.]
MVYPATVPWDVIGKKRLKPKKHAGILIDLRRCVGCHSCSLACKTEHDVPLGCFRTRVRYLEKADKPTLKFLPLICMHCRDAPCLKACPCQAIIRREDKTVIIDKDRCSSEKACIKACPYDAIYIDPATDKADKCDLCVHRTGLGMEPACVNVCPTNALKYCDLDDPEDPVVIYAKKHDARAFKKEAGTNPSVLYIGLEKWMGKKPETGIQLSSKEDEIIYVQK